MDFEGIMLSEISQTQKDKYCMISYICGIWKTNKQQQKQNPKTQTKPTERRERRPDGGIDGTTGSSDELAKGPFSPPSVPSITIETNALTDERKSVDYDWKKILRGFAFCPVLMISASRLIGYGQYHSKRLSVRQKTSGRTFIMRRFGRSISERE